LAYGAPDTMIGTTETEMLETALLPALSTAVAVIVST
jgi:hypothetical protein